MVETGQMPPSVARSWDDVGDKLFVPEHYVFDDLDEQLRFIAAHPMASIFSAHEGDLRVTIAPILFDEKDGHGVPRFIGHMAGRNPHAAAIAEGAEVVAQFSAPGTYISPRWFRKNMVAATWSYLSVQVRGTFEPLASDNQIMDVITRTVSHMESMTPCQAGEDVWTVDQLSDEQIDRYVSMIAAFRLMVTSIEGVRRLNQEKEVEDVTSIVDGLAASPHAGAGLIRDLMQQNALHLKDQT